MTESTRSCPRCQARMTAGALRTPYGGGYGYGMGASWRARWEGEGGPYRVVAYRCPSCGAVELAGTERPVRMGCFGTALLLVGAVAGIFWVTGRVLAG
jgi:hypothetical protein